MNNALINLAQSIANSIGVNLSINTLIKLLDIYLRIIETLANDSEIQKTGLNILMENLRAYMLSESNYGDIKSVKGYMIITNDLVAEDKISQEEMDAILDNLVFFFQTCNQFIYTVAGFIDSFIQTQMDLSEQKDDFSNCEMSLAAVIDGNVRFTIIGKANKEGHIYYNILSSAINGNIPECPVVIR